MFGREGYDFEFEADTKVLPAEHPSLWGLSSFRAFGLLQAWQGCSSRL